MLNLVLSLSLSHTGHWKFNMAPHGKELKHVWQQPGEEYKDKCVLLTVKHGGGSVMIWGCMSAAGTGELQFIEGTMIANMYCGILKQSMIPSETGLF